MVMPEHQHDDALPHSVDAQHMEDGSVEHDGDAEAPHEQTEGETVGLIVIVWKIVTLENCDARLENNSFEMQKSSLPFSHVPFATPGRIRNIQPISGIRISTFDGAMVFLFSWSQT